MIELAVVVGVEIGRKEEGVETTGDGKGTGAKKDGGRTKDGGILNAIGEIVEREEEETRLG